MKQRIITSALSLIISASMMGSVVYAGEAENTANTATASTEKTPAKAAPKTSVAPVASLPSAYDAYKNWNWPSKNKGATDLSTNYAANELIEAYIWKENNVGVNFSNQYLNYLTASDATADGNNMYAEQNTTITEDGATLFKRTLGQSQSMSDLLNLNIQGHGPVLETAFSDTTQGTLANDTALKISPEYYVLSQGSLKGLDESSLTQESMAKRQTDIKNAVANYGAVSYTYHLDSSFITDKNAMYQEADAESDAPLQTGVIVGWDDAYPASNFKSKYGYMLPGAFVVRAYNGQKTADGDEYYYVSYYDKSVNSNDNYYVSSVVNKDEVKGNTDDILAGVTDKNLKSYLTDVLKVDANGDGKLTYGEIGAVRNVDVSKDVYPKTVDSLDGLGEFSYIESLSARKQPVKTVFAPDFYYLRELDMSNSGLTEFTPSYYNDIGTLQSLKVDHTNLYSLDLYAHNNLRTLSADQTQMNNDRFKVTKAEDGTYTIDLAQYIGEDIAGITFTPQEGMRVDGTKLIFDAAVFDGISNPREVIYNYNTNVNANTAQAQITGVNNNMQVSIMVYPPDVSIDVVENLNLRWYLQNRQLVDTNKDGMLSYSERASLKYIDVSYDTFPFWVTSLKGIEYFPNLDTLMARKQPITQLDTSQNTNLLKLDIARSAVGSVDFSKNTKLTDLNILSNNLYTLDLSNNTNLKTLSTEQYHFNKTDVPKLVDGKYQINLKDYVGEANLSKVTVTEAGASYDNTTGIVTFDGDKDSFKREFNYTYEENLPAQVKESLTNYKTNVMLYLYAPTE